MGKFKVTYLVNVINPKGKTLSISRKRQTMIIDSELDDDEILARREEFAPYISIGLTRKGIMVFDTPEIISVKPHYERKANGSGIRNLKKRFL